MIRPLYLLLLMLGTLFIVAGCTYELNPTNLPTATIDLPGNPGTISFDDMNFDPVLGKILVPASNSTRLDLIDPDTHAIKTISGFSSLTVGGVPQDGVTSVTSSPDLLYATDRGALKLDVIDPVAGAIITSTNVMTTPDYIRYVSATNELWVTEKGLSQIEVFSISKAKNAPPVHSTVIPVPDGPEALVIDNLHGLAYTNRPSKGVTAVIQVMTHNIITDWGNGCSSARGLAMDEENQFLFVACREGKVVMIDASTGSQLANQSYGGSLDFIGYNPDLQHVYVPSSASAILAIFGVTKTVASPTSPPKYSLVRLGTADTALKAKCITSDNRGEIWVCNPNTGQLMVIKDTFPASDNGGG